MKYLNKKIVIYAIIILALLVAYLVLANWPIHTKKLDNIKNSQNVSVDDINNDNWQEITIFSIDGKLLNTEIYTLKNGKLLPIVFKNEDKEVEIWSEKRPEFIDLNNDGKKEIVITHFLAGEILTETIIVKEYFRWNGECYEKYNEEKNIEDSGFQG